ncbi:50S ribosomal protein L10 [Candidatus Amesbacteria bacterium RIFCSPLOWO2_01_FULL_49_25]|uniref:Large ribosomal subunit protein uL10 n=1 Tax=Candidatus Amesbacteria bacterium RIFCSPHIGHO2_01_FULL_48_32b TaxID=1797253 RepID=A0A1F4YGL8_9BACT|nr:MAG: 50S ribosomal protein L10 [Candidatus Amesbacteria bacterium RIFCSPHIGHO2_01_FULL_48_32b]OGD06912.1 MAG: 50S ribosomal protein L10 [Candidatus Amesbacteria bacterium RIFCSPLOWO2_01_FULL_49_25]
MISPKKTSVVAALKNLLSQAKSVAIVDYRGLKVSQATLLRQQIKKAGGQMVIAKNTLFKIALGKKIDLSGTNAFVFSLSDEVAPLKTIAEFAKKNPAAAGLSFKSGILADRVLSAAEVSQLSSIPDKPTLAAKLVGSLNSPLFNLAYNLNWNITKLVRTLKEVSLTHV